ncbi:MAG: hypothetical protein ACREEM_20130 [Blastocatellia bacterium]
MKKCVTHQLIRSLILMAISLQCAQAQERAGTTLINDALQSKTSGKPDGKGEFVSGGWRSAGGRIIFDAGRQIEDGSFEAKLAGFTVPAEGADKSHVLAAYESGDSLDQGKEKGSFLMWRIGALMPFKVLAASDSLKTRQEKEVKSHGPKLINDGKPHTYRVAWKAGKIEFFIDGRPAESFTFPRASLRYFVVGTDRSMRALITNPAPIISDIKVVDFGAPPPAEPIAERDVPRFTVYEKALTASGSYANPYKEVNAVAAFVRHNGAGARRLPLFWDGGKTWSGGWLTPTARDCS